jgi:flavorubredoxin
MFPELMLAGDLRTYHLYLPGKEDRFRHMEAGEVLALGERSLMMVPALVHDLPNTLWGYEPTDQILFVSDAYPYTHDHAEGQCAMISSELPRAPVAEDTSRVIEGALNWTRFVDPEVIAAELDDYLKQYPTRLIAPAHGAVTIEPDLLTDVFKSGIRRVSGAS